MWFQNIAFLFLGHVFATSHSFFLSMKNPQPGWKKLQFSIKEKARNWFIERATKGGIPWVELYNKYNTQQKELNSYKFIKEDKKMIYPSYYTMPFHGYDDGNLDWEAAKETEAATVSISANYWKGADPYDAQEWLRQNITKNIADYIGEVQHNEFIPRRALDVGCSVGISTEYLKQQFPQSDVTGMDMSPYFIGVACLRNEKSENKIDYVHANAEKTKYQDKYFDFIVCNFLFHELPESATKEVIREMHRLLAPQGVFAVVDMDPEKIDAQLSNNVFRKWAFESTEPHIYQYYERNVSSLLEDAGFKHLQKKENDPLNAVWLGQK